MAHQSVDQRGIKISKLDAARQQLRTAIRLWFLEGDAVAIHTLVCAAYEILHFISKKRKPDREGLFDTIVIKDEYRKLWAKKVKEPANFFKHARSDPPDAIIEFFPLLSELFIMYALRAIADCGEKLQTEELAFEAFLMVHRPEWLKAEFRQIVQDSVAVEDLRILRTVKKHEFLHTYEGALLMARLHNP